MFFPLRSTNPFAKSRPDSYEVRMAVVKKAHRKPVVSTSISTKELLQELPGSKLVTFEAGAVIFREGSTAEDCFVITQGKVRILKKTHKREEIPLGLVKTGEFLGEMAMISGERRSASAVAVTRVKAIKFAHTEFVSLLRQQNPFASRLSLQICTLLATRCHALLRLIARRPDVVPLALKKAPPVDVRAVLDRVYTLWAV